ncbi:MAG: hypothetical protein E4H20_04440 [Spirochaetales bacterium]|nr:MAG: hypothetical protein E4H20_04440 [Spirochaetales bacterium]
MSPLPHRIASVFSLMSRLPVRLRDQPDYSSADWMIPVTGLLAAATACVGAGLGLALFRNEILAAVVSIAFQYLAFNLFHFDGLVDTADAIGAFGDAEKRRIALKDPRIGTFGLFAGAMALFTRVTATAVLLGMAGIAPWAALALAAPVGRMAAMVVVSSGKPVGKSGLGAAIGESSPLKAAFGYIAAALPAAFLWGLIFGAGGSALSLIAGALVAIAVGLGIGAWYHGIFGGYTGDALGAAIEIAEIGVLAAAVAVLG